jgi:hypothetical protein
MKPNALRWHFDRPSLHLRPHGVQRFFASASALNPHAKLIAQHGHRGNMSSGFQTFRDGLPQTERRSACWAIFFYFFVIAGGAI